MVRFLPQYHYKLYENNIRKWLKTGILWYFSVRSKINDNFTFPCIQVRQYGVVALMGCFHGLPNK